MDPDLLDAVNQYLDVLGLDMQGVESDVETIYGRSDQSEEEDNDDWYMLFKCQTPFSFYPKLPNE